MGRIMKRMKKRTKKHVPKVVRPSDLFLTFSPEVAEGTRQRLAISRAMSFKALTGGGGTEENIACLQSAIEVAWALASRFRDKEDPENSTQYEICLLLVCATAELTAMSTLIRLGRSGEIEEWMFDALRHTMNLLDDLDAAVTQAEYLRAIQYTQAQSQKLLTVAGARVAACISPEKGDSWQKIYDHAILAYLNGRPVRGFFIVRKGVLYFCGPEQAADGEDALIRITGPHVVAVCAPFSQEAKETIEKAREKEK